MPALLALLAQEGYGENDIEYRSHRTLVHQGHLVHDIQFLQVPHRRVILTVNLGLLGVQSPLPAFLLQTMEQTDPLEAERMERFLGYFDHELLRARFAGLYPEQNSALLPGWENATQHRLSLLNLTSPSTLHWLFIQAYPEAEVSVRRKVHVQPVATQGSQLSATTLGDSTALGGFASVPTGGLEVVLFFNESQCGMGIPWAIEAPRRLTQGVLPLLVQTSLPLTVQMALRDQSAPARLQQDSYLGYAPLVDAENRPQQFILFCGKTSHQEPAGLTCDGLNTNIVS
ncbi:type VI secretion system baseplate subunit TssG [Archangium violaceum]|uniref:type VI secretion system baseplate subunit TssG n=1 Tax=Archangium violaceum TaxID=83451 RepID=UPI001EF44110|nr:type VI secretion system baseplate subunit TssG [Archangium violaceum]